MYQKNNRKMFYQNMRNTPPSFSQNLLSLSQTTNFGSWLGLSSLMPPLLTTLWSLLILTMRCSTAHCCSDLTDLVSWKPPLLIISFFFPLFLLPGLDFRVVAHNGIGFGGVRGDSLVVWWGCWWFSELHCVEINALDSKTIKDNDNSLYTSHIVFIDHIPNQSSNSNASKNFQINSQRIWF